MKVLPLVINIFFCLLIVTCSKEVSNSDNINEKASIPDSFRYPLKDFKVITSFVSKQMGTMSTLYGNQLAWQKALGFNKEMEADEIFLLVTWKQQPDQHWFGANIPGDLLSIEVLKTISGKDTVAVNYEMFEGKMLALKNNPLGQSDRIKFILTQRPSVMP